jgi:U3 small nucleolar ribonucleoprotein protein IMP3
MTFNIITFKIITQLGLVVCRLYAMGVITTKKSLTQVEALPTSAFCRRRLAVVMVRLKMAETMQEAVTLVEQVGSIVAAYFCVVCP